MSHIPGPWRLGADRGHVGDHIITSAGGVLLARTYGANAGDNDGPKGFIASHSEETDATARLIVAAPELLAVCKLYETMDGPEWNELRKAAIAKAEGK